MAIKEKAGLIALAAGALSFLGFILPYIWISQMGISILIWSWGLSVLLGAPFPVPPEFYSGIMFAGVLIIISAIILLATGTLAKKREDIKILGIAMVVAAILGLIGVLVPLADPVVSLAIMIGGLSVGFYLPLIGSIVGIIAGAVAVAIK